MPMIELNKGRYALVTETAISLFAEVAQLLFVKRVANKRQHDADGRLDIAKACQRSDVLPRKGGPALWQVQSRSEEHTSELQSLMRISYAVFCLKKKKKRTNTI